MVVSLTDREIVVSLANEKAEHEKRACQIVVGFSAFIDPLSGMTVNLMQIEQWLDQLEKDFSGANFTNFCQLHQEIENWFFKKIPAQVDLDRIEIKYNLGKEKIIGLRNSPQTEKNTEKNSETKQTQKEIFSDQADSQPTKQTLLFHEITTEDHYQGEPVEKTTRSIITDRATGKISAQSDSVEYYFKKSGVKLSGKSSENL